jgi:CID domain
VLCTHNKHRLSSDPTLYENKKQKLQDKVKVNTLTMIAEDYADSPKDASELCRLIRDRLVSTKIRGDHKLPLVYVVDSILKNVQGTYVSIMEKDIMEWMPIVATALPEHDERRGKPKLKKVWMLWKNSGIFSLDVWQRLGECFSASSSSLTSGSGSVGALANPSSQVLTEAGIEFGVRHLLVVASSSSALKCFLFCSSTPLSSLSFAQTKSIRL